MLILTYRNTGRLDLSPSFPSTISGTGVISVFFLDIMAGFQ
jgi:hypothetical protein